MCHRCRGFFCHMSILLNINFTYSLITLYVNRLCPASSLSVFSYQHWGLSAFGCALTLGDSILWVSVKPVAPGILCFRSTRPSAHRCSLFDTAPPACNWKRRWPTIAPVALAPGIPLAVIGLLVSSGREI